MFVKNIIGFFKVYGVAIAILVLLFEWAMSGHLFFLLFSLLGITYFVVCWPNIKKEHQRMETAYLRWIEGRHWFILFLISIPVSFSINILQTGIIIILERFTPFLPGVIADIALLTTNVIAFLSMRTYLFRYQKTDYVRQVITYIVVMTTNLAVNFLAVQWTHDYLIPNLKAIIPWLSLLTNFFTDTAVAQVMVAAALGWIWFLAHKNITFRKS